MRLMAEGGDSFQSVALHEYDARTNVGGFLHKDAGAEQAVVL